VRRGPSSSKRSAGGPGKRWASPRSRSRSTKQGTPPSRSLQPLRGSRRGVRMPLDGELGRPSCPSTPVARRPARTYAPQLSLFLSTAAAPRWFSLAGSRNRARGRSQERPGYRVHLQCGFKGTQRPPIRGEGGRTRESRVAPRPRVWVLCPTPVFLRCGGQPWKRLTQRFSERRSRADSR
jgi:hypothetical protein